MRCSCMDILLEDRQRKPMKKIFLLFFFISIYSIALSQRVTIQGITRSAESLETLSGISILESGSNSGTVSNRYGFFSISVPKGTVNLLISGVGVSAQEVLLQVNRDTSVTFLMQGKSLSEVVISASVKPNRIPLSRMSLRSEELEAVPPLLGEPDMVKALALLPGVNLALEGSSALAVRGGNPDQNLILLDGAKVFNPTHLFGIISVFNTDAIEQVILYKGNFPAQFGGKVASVMDIQLKEGTSEVAEVKGSIGLLSSRISFSGPIGKQQNAHYLLTARASYLGLFLSPIYLAYRSGGAESFLNYWLYDINAKVNRDFANGSKLYASFYTGQDFMTTREGEFQRNESIAGFTWYNQTLSLRYTMPIGKKVFWSNQTTFSRYQFRLKAEEVFTNTDPLTNMEEQGFLRLASISGIHNAMGQSVVDVYPGAGHNLQIGIQADYFGYNPQEVRIEASGETARVESISNLRSVEPQAWIQDRWNIGLFMIEGGIRAHGSVVSDTSYLSLEPRIQAEWKVTNHLFVNAGWGRTSQFSHVISATQLGLPGDVWVPVSEGLLPQVANQWAVGISGSTIDEKWEASIELYQRRTQNLSIYLPDFVDVGLLPGEDFLTQLNLGGEGLANGLELFFRTSQNGFQGWASYTLAESRQRFEQFQQGKWQPTPFDIRHSIKIVGSQELDQQWKLSGMWIFQSGRPFYLPTARVPDIDGGSYVFYPDDPLRFPAYHRLDLGVEFSPSSSKTWSFGVYNVYNRLNPTFLRINRPRNGLEGEVVGVTILPFLPYVSYSWTL